MNLVGIIGLEENTLSDTDTLKLINLLEINEEFFSKLDIKKISKHADYIRHSNTECDYENDSFNETPDTEINNFIMHNVYDMFYHQDHKDHKDHQPNEIKEYHHQEKGSKRSFFTIVNGRDLINNNDKKGTLHLNLCYFDFQKIYKKSWITGKEIIRVKTSIIYIYISPMFATIHQLYGQK